MHGDEAEAEARCWTEAAAAQVYNLPETVRESDVEKLSFAVQLADGFYARSQARIACHLFS